MQPHHGGDAAQPARSDPKSFTLFNQHKTHTHTQTYEIQELYDAHRSCSRVHTYPPVLLLSTSTSRSVSSPALDSTSVWLPRHRIDQKTGIFLHEIQLDLATLDAPPDVSTTVTTTPTSSLVTDTCFHDNTLITQVVSLSLTQHQLMITAHFFTLRSRRRLPTTILRHNKRCIYTNNSILNLPLLGNTIYRPFIAVTELLLDL